MQSNLDAQADLQREIKKLQLSLEYKKSAYVGLKLRYDEAGQ